MATMAHGKEADATRSTSRLLPVNPPASSLERHILANRESGISDGSILFSSLEASKEQDRKEAIQKCCQIRFTTQIFVCFVATYSQFVGGTCSTYTAQALPSLRKDFKDTTKLEEVLISEVW
ncbi:unnamed protein product, partial [Cyprideis torosa]